MKKRHGTTEDESPYGGSMPVQMLRSGIAVLSSRRTVNSIDIVPVVTVAYGCHSFNKAEIYRRTEVPWWTMLPHILRSGIAVSLVHAHGQFS